MIYAVFFVLVNKGQFIYVRFPPELQNEWTALQVSLLTFLGIYSVVLTILLGILRIFYRKVKRQHNSTETSITLKEVPSTSGNNHVVKMNDTRADTLYPLLEK